MLRISDCSFFSCSSARASFFGNSALGLSSISTSLQEFSRISQSSTYLPSSALDSQISLPSP